MDWLYYENTAYEKGYNLVCGVDEAGRGPLAGPVCAAAVVLPKGLILEGVNDSKKLTERKGKLFFDVITEQALDWSIAFATVEEIEEINILNAAMLAMKRAVEELKNPVDFAIIDGNRKPPLEIDCEAVVKGDAKSMSVAAASILAKVSRDRILRQYAVDYPQYGFEKHKGYGTKVHVEALKNTALVKFTDPAFEENTEMMW